MRKLLDTLSFPIATISLILCWLLFVFFFHNSASILLFICGNITLFTGMGIIILAIRTLRKKGQLQNANDFTATTSLVTNGIYSVVRHPLYLGWLLTYPAAMLVSQHWLVIIFGFIGIAGMVRIAAMADRKLLEKFGSAYEQYVEEVPRLNVILGFARKLTRKN